MQRKKRAQAGEGARFKNKRTKKKRKKEEERKRGREEERKREPSGRAKQGEGDWWRKKQQIKQVEEGKVEMP